MVFAAGEFEGERRPTVYGTIAVRGYRLPHAMPDNEAIVEIPAELVMEAARALGG
jgi:hypothetical protein